MKWKKNSGEDKNLPVHNNKKKVKSPFSRKKKDGKAKKEKQEKKAPLTIEQEILRMREEEKKKAEKKPYSKKENKAQNHKTPARKKQQPKEKTETKKPHTPKKKFPEMKKSAPVRIIPLGGLGEIGKNMTVVETDESMIVIDCGMGFPDDGMPGVDLVIPDTAYLEENIHKLRGIFLTHGHEDHIGAIPYVLRKVNVPLFGTKLTLGIVENKLVEFGLDKEADLRTVRAGETVRAGDFDVEFISVNHSIADAVAFAIHSPAGVLVFTGDFKIDSTPIAGR